MRVNLSVPAAIDAELSAAAVAQGVSKAALVMQAITWARPHWRRAVLLVRAGGAGPDVPSQGVPGEGLTKKQRKVLARSQRLGARGGK